jgi:membrane-associated phospholipid phosphatase
MKARRRDRELESTLLIGAVVAATVLTALTVRLADAPPTALDRRVQRRVLRRATVRSHRLAWMIGGPGYPGIYFPATAALIAALRRHGRPAAEALAIASIGGWATHRFIKLFANRRRPRSMRGRKNEFEAFPSGHTTATTAIALTAAYILARRRMVPASTAATIGTLIPLSVGSARVLADEHWTTDVIGGWIGGAGVATLAALRFERTQSREFGKLLLRQ